MNKQLAIAESIINTATVIAGLAKQLPKTGKHRNIFIKTYNRRPMNKNKRALLLAQIAWSTYMGAIQTRTIISQPIPKYQKGSLLSDYGEIVSKYNIPNIIIESPSKGSV